MRLAQRTLPTGTPIPATSVRARCARARMSLEDEWTASAALGDAQSIMLEEGEDELGLVAEVPPPRRRKRDRRDKSPNNKGIGRPGLKGFKPSVSDIDKVRPSLDDVERISRGERARQRGVGSRATPHRLNADERAAFERAKRYGLLSLRGTGYRKERKGSPLLNTFRQLCDARAHAAVWLEIGVGAVEDAAVVDLAPLRDPERIESARAATARVAAQSGWAIDEAAASKIEAFRPTEEQLRTQPIWNVPFDELRFVPADIAAASDDAEAAPERAAHKALAKALADALNGAQPQP